MSTDEQASSGLGLEAQRSAIATAAARMKVELLHIESDEGVSGSVPPLERPGLARAIAELGRGDVLLVAKRDRLARDVLEVALLERSFKKRGIRIVSAAGEGTESDDPSALLQRGIVDLFAQHEREMIRARTRAALRAKRDRGERTGSLPYGYTVGADGKLVEVLEEQRALEFIRSMRATGAGLRAIAAKLNADQVKPKRGARWYASSVKSVLETDRRTPPIS